MNVGVILAAGKSTRFQSSVPKQLYEIDGKPIINHSIDILSQTLDEVIIVTNSNCYSQINTNKKILINDIDDRIKSIEIALDYLRGGDIENILIHDSARPFITTKHIDDLLKSQLTNVHSQYYFPLLNGLAKKNELGFWEIPNRNDHIELCSPQITNFDLFNSIFYEKIKTGIECEILPVVSQMKLNFNLISGDYKSLRKITSINDL